jgi:hypothetical protein
VLRVADGLDLAQFFQDDIPKQRHVRKEWHVIFKNLEM